MIRFALIGAIALVTLIGAAAAQQRQLQQPHNQPNQQQAAPDNRGTDQVPFVVKELSRQRTDEERKEADEKSELDRKLAGYTADLAAYTKWLFGATVALAILTGALAFAAFLQMREGRRSIRAAEDAAKAAADSARHLESSITEAARSADAMEGVAAAMTQNVANTRELLERQREFARHQMRAYVFVHSASIANVAPSPTRTLKGQQPSAGSRTIRDRGPIVLMAIRNSGNTPANNVVHIANVIYREFPLAAPLPAIETVAGDPRTMSVFTVPPAGIITKNVVFPQILTSQQIAELRAATHAIYIYGRITYTDVFGENRTTNYRYLHNAHTGVIGMTSDVTGSEQGNDST